MSNLSKKVIYVDHRIGRRMGHERDGLSSINGVNVKITNETSRIKTLFVLKNILKSTVKSIII